MGLNKSVNSLTAKLLKEKGFVCHKSDKFWRDGFSFDKKDYNQIAYQDKDNVATIAEVIIWLYEKHGIWISVIQNEYEDKFQYTITQRKSDSWYIVDNGKLFNTPTEAYENSIEYVLKN